MPVCSLVPAVTTTIIVTAIFAIVDLALLAVVSSYLFLQRRVCWSGDVCGIPCSDLPESLQASSGVAHGPELESCLTAPHPRLSPSAQGALSTVACPSQGTVGGGWAAPLHPTVCLLVMAAGSFPAQRDSRAWLAQPPGPRAADRCPLLPSCKGSPIQASGGQRPACCL